MRRAHANVTRILNWSNTAACRRRYATSMSNSSTSLNSSNAFVTQGNAYDENVSGGLLQELPIAVKDNICTKDFRTTCSSGILQDFIPPLDATVVRLLRSAGARVIGKTNCDEFGMGSHNIHSIHGPVINPHIPPENHSRHRIRDERSAGGSSGGSAAAVASEACYAALSTDTGGSTRLPAAYCGIAGLKPSYGLISRWGVVSYADSLDCVGIMAKKCRDVERVFQILSVYDEKDPTCISNDSRAKAKGSYHQMLRDLSLNSTSLPLEGLTFGIPQEYFPAELDSSSYAPLENLITKLKSRGARVLPASLPSTPYALSAYYVLASAEASSNLARYTGIHFGSRETLASATDRTKAAEVYSSTRSKGFGSEVQKRILLGTYALTADAFDNYFLQAQRVRNLIKSDFNRTFRSQNPLSPVRSLTGTVDVLLHPSAVSTAPRLSDLHKAEALEEYVQDVLTVPASLAGLPALSVPVGIGEDGFPLGVSVVGQWGSDELVLRMGHVIESLVE